MMPTVIQERSLTILKMNAQRARQNMGYNPKKNNPVKVGSDSRQAM